MTSQTKGSSLSLDDLWVDRAAYRPGQAAHLRIVLRNWADTPRFARLNVRLGWLDEPVWEQHQQIEIPPGKHDVTLPLQLPPVSFRGYGIDLILHDDDGHSLRQESTALDVLDDWMQAPRYGFLVQFAPGSEDAAAVVATLARYHINVVQFYDWMWRHYTLMPPSEEFIDACGRPLSLKVVREKVTACGSYGMATLGYAAVYGAEAEYALAHPEEMLYDGAGAPYSLEKLFYIMNIHRGNSWRTRILSEMARAVREVPFDGLHLDQYGFPTEQAFGPPPGSVPYDLAADFPPFIDDAHSVVQQARPGSGIIFNAVRNWPIETVAPTSQDATYIEVWPPYESYQDLQTLILGARQLAPQKQVILAAYIEPLKNVQGDDLPYAEAATRLASAAIWANGGFHLLMGESNGALCDPYYPAYALMRPDFARVMRHYYDFVVRYENALSDLRLATINGREAQDMVRLHGLPSSTTGEAGKVWVIVRQMPGLYTVSLVNLSQARDAYWNAPKPPPLPLHNLEIEVRVEGEIQGIFAASPDRDGGRPCQVVHHAIQKDGGTTEIRANLPCLEFWSMIVIKMSSDHPVREGIGNA